MKRLTCEMCGGSDLIKQDGVFICQHCGAKYSVEEAKKIMIEGNVDVSGSTVTIDASGELANLYQIARRARDDNNSENAAKYYDMILVKDPTSWEAAFYVVYFKAMECKIAEIRSAANNVANCEGSVLELIRDHVPENEQLSAVLEVVYRSILIASMLSVGAANHYSGISADIKSNYMLEYLYNFWAARDILYTCGNEIERVFEGRVDIIRLTAVEAWKAGINIHEQMPRDLMSILGENDAFPYKKKMEYREKIGKYDPVMKKENECLKKQEEIENSKKSINSLEYAKDLRNIGILFLIIGTIGMLIRFVVYFVSNEVSIFLMLLDIYLIIWGGWRTLKKGIEYENNQEKLNNEKERLASLEAELKILEAEQEAAKKEQKK